MRRVSQAIALGDDRSHDQPGYTRFMRTCAMGKGHQHSAILLQFADKLHAARGICALARERAWVDTKSKQ